MRPHGSHDIADFLISVLQVAVAAMLKEGIVKFCIQFQIQFKVICLTSAPMGQFEC